MLVINDRLAQGLTAGQDDMEIEIFNDKYCKHDREKEDHDLEKIWFVSGKVTMTSFLRPSPENYVN